MYQLNVRDRSSKRPRGVIASVTWKRRRGQALVKHFTFKEQKESGIRFFELDDAKNVAASLAVDFGLDVTVQKV